MQAGRCSPTVAAWPASMTSEVCRPHAKELSMAFLATYSAGGLHRPSAVRRSLLMLGCCLAQRACCASWGTWLTDPTLTPRTSQQKTCGMSLAHAHSTARPCLGILSVACTGIVWCLLLLPCSNTILSKGVHPHIMQPRCSHTRCSKAAFSTFRLAPSTA